MRSARTALYTTAGVGVLVLALGGTSVAKDLIGSSDIKDNSIRSKDVRDGTLTAKDLKSNSVGRDEIQAGAVGSSELAPNSVGSSAIIDGSVGVNDLSDAAANRIQSDVFVGENWGQILRNTREMGVATLRSGPYFGSVEPPLGHGSLQLLTGNDTSQVMFGNEVDFVGDNLVSTLGANVGFSVFTTGENNARGAHNLPNIKFEIDPNVSGVSSNYGTLNFVPTKDAADNAWTSFDANDGYWYLTGNAGKADGGGINCNQTTTCTFAQIKDRLGSATVLSAGVGKGTDKAFQGAVDALRIGGTVYDFEARGVFARAV